MRIIRCDICGAEIEEGGKKHLIPTDNGWCTLNGTRICERWQQDICPMCMPIKKDKLQEQPKTNRDEFEEIDNEN